MAFELFDPEAEVRFTSGSLPHWFQPGATYFVTFRTDDSFPRLAADQWRAERLAWLLRHSIDPKRASWEAALDRLPRPLRQEYHRTFTAAYEAQLDRGVGACLLHNPTLAAVVGDAIRHFDGDRYHIDSFVVMPNHVHVLIGLRNDADILRVCYSWKKFTATEINRRTDRGGRFWQEESFDHLVRSPEQFEYLRGYIAENPRRAGLGEGEYLLYTVAGRHTECAYHSQAAERHTECAYHSKTP